MKKALLMGVSGAAMLFAAQAFASGEVSQGQSFLSANVQGQGQASKNYAGGGDGGTAKAYADGGSSGGLFGHGSGGDAAAKAYSGDGGTAASKSAQNQLQGQVVAGSQTQTVKLPDITVTVATPGAGTGGAAGPGVGGDTGDGGNSVGAGGYGNSQQSPVQTGVSDAAQASFRSRAAADITGTAILGDNVNYNSYNTTMTNTTTMSATNTVGGISLSSGTANGGAATGGNLNPDQSALTGNLGRGGDADSTTGPTYTGAGGTGGNGTAVSANLGLQGAKSYTSSEGGNGTAYSSAYGSSKSAAVGVSGAGAAAGNLGGAGNSTHAHSGGFFGNDAKAAGSAKNYQDADAWAQSWSNPDAKANTNAQSAALGTGGNGGDVASKTGNSANQQAKSAASGGNGGNSGDAYAKAYGTGGDLSQVAGSTQILNAATGGTQGGNGGNSSVTFGSGAIGGIALGTMSGIANIAQNTGLTANQFSSFSINAHTNF